MLSLRQNLIVTLAMLQSAFLSGCGLKVVSASGEAVIPPAAYCSTVTAYSSPITVSGTAYYAPRTNGNGEVADGGYRYRPVAAVVNGATYSITISGTTYSRVASGDTEQSIAQSLANAINANSAAPVTASVLRLRGVSSFEYYTLVNLKSFVSPWPGAVTRSKSATLTETARAAPSPIRHAEIMVKNSSGNIIQCGSTNASGAYSVSLPQGSAGTYTVYVNSRANDATIARAYVLDYHATNVHYSVTKTVATTATSSANNLLASGEGSVLSGAFNILDQIVKANEFLAQQVDAAHGCGTTYTNCTPYTPAPIVYAYWKKGVNPYSYFGVSSPSSFYVGNSKLYILGGVNGDVDNSDCDHFDNSVIIHEYGHFLEDAFAVSESPGGYHNGNAVIDPRLAWSEGWSDFIQSAVTGIEFYRDTKGNSSGTIGGSVLINENIDTTTWDTPSAGAEGLFREFSITRLLWDAIDPHPVTGNGGTDGGTDTVSSPNAMAEIWTVFAGTNGLKALSNPFRHMGTFHKIQANMGVTNWGPLRVNEFQNGNAAYTGVGLREYATPLTTIACGTTAISPVADGGDFDGSDLLVNNDFLSYYHSGGSLTVQLKYTASAPANPPDLDLYVYKSDYTYGTSSTMIGYSQGARPANCVGTPANCVDVSEVVSASAPAGYYLINVMAYTLDSAGMSLPGGAANYKILVNGVQQCLTP